MPKVRALKEVRYASTVRHPGDVFDVANDRDVRLLVAIGKVELVPSGKAAKAGKADEPAKVEPAKVEPVADKPAAEPETEAETEAAATKRRYQRRDMTANGE